MNSFHWGVSASAAQTEGAALHDDKGPSIWDEFSKRRNKTFQNATPEPGAGFYYKYENDIGIIDSLNIPNFRFSISWPRILPNGTGEINRKGIEFYNRVIDGCLAKNITPWITLYHWDLPHQLELHGGWTNRSILNWFENYVQICCSAFGDRVKNWMVLNEPMAFCGAGYFLGIHAPGRRGRQPFMAASHHAVMATSLGAQIIRNMVPKAYIGTTFSAAHITPYSNEQRDIEAAKRADDLLNNFFVYPTTGNGYPLKRLKFLNGIEKFILAGDENKMKADLDFVGVQTYTREVIKHSFITPFLKASNVSATKRKVQHTEMGWEVIPESIYEVLKKFAEIKGIPSLIVTENGAAFKDTVTDNNKINDQSRCDYLNNHINMVMKAKNEGVDVKGYFVWSLTDNFEWAEGYRPRFGLVHIDYENDLKRTIKESGKLYSSIINSGLIK